jgi:hypothetical protein
MSTLSLPEQILAVMAARLADTRPAPGAGADPLDPIRQPALEQDRVIDLELEDLPARILSPVASAPRPQQNWNRVIDERLFTVRLALRAAPAGELSGRQVADQMLVWAVQRTCGPVTPASAFYGLCTCITQGETTYHYEKTAPAACMIVVDLLVSYWSAVEDPTRG